MTLYRIKMHVATTLFLLVVLIHYDCTHSQSIPEFINLPQDKTILQEGKEAYLPCSAKGSPEPKIISWLNNNNQVDFKNNFLRTNGELYIPKATRSHSGEYQCVASNNVGGVASVKREIIVAYFDRLQKPAEERQELKVNEFLKALPPPEVKCEPKPKYLWTKNGIPIVETDRLSINIDGGLYISNLKSEDAGTYRLVVENTFLKNLKVEYSSQEARIIVLGVYGMTELSTSKIIYSSQKQLAGEKKTPLVTLECFVSGLQLNLLEITWKKIDKNGNSFALPRSSKYIRRDGNRRLDIKEPTYKEDNGVFQCVVVYGLSIHATKNVELDVHSQPNFLLKPKNQISYTDNSTMLNCTSSANPEQTQRWYRNGIPVPNSEIFKTYVERSFQLKKLNWEDNGIFQCGAENFAGLFFATVEVKVQNKSAEILNDFRDVYAGKNMDVHVPCVVVGAPKPDIYWLVNSSRITLPSSKYTLLENGTLQISDMKIKDGGRYTCVANNRIGIVEKSTIVAVITPTSFKNRPKSETLVRKGSNVDLPCEVTHDININYTREWRQNNIPVSDDRYVLQKDGSLQIQFAKLIDTAIEFSCHVFSSGGNISAFTTLILVQLPLTPSSPRDSEVQAYALRLTWDAPDNGGSPLTGYKMFMKNYTMTSFYVLVNLKADTTSYLVENLVAGSKYRFKVAAENKFGVGDSSDETDWIETQTLAPSAAPYGFQAVSAEIDSVTLAWVIPPRETHNGVLEGFYIDYRVSGSTQGFGRFDVKGGELTSFTMNSLPEFTRYEVKIAAVNKAGQSEWSSIQFVETKQGVPSAGPTNVSVSVINATSVYVSFDSPPQGLWNGKLTSIVARTWPPERPQDQTEYRTPYDSSSLYHQKFVLPNLKADTEYTLAVAVATTGGASKGSSFVQFKTSEGVPDAVRNLQVSGIYSDAFSVRWMPPLKPAGVLQGYRVKFRLFAIGNWVEFTEPSTALGAVIKPLKPRTRYEVNVAAFTSKGAGSYVGASVETIESPVLPTAPSNLKAYAIYGNNISLGWIPGDSGRAVILHYIIEYNNDTAYHFKNPETAIWREIRNLTKILENPANITNLKPSTTYRFRMTAFNRVGASPVSNISEDITTSEGVPSKAPTQISATSPDRQTLLLKWTPPTKQSWNSGSIKYQFLIKPKGQDPRIKTPYMEHQDTQASSYLVRGLKKYTMYNVTMRLFNDKGHGPWSEPLFVRTSEDYPAGAPIISNVRALNHESVELTWGNVPLEQRNGIILGYMVYYMIANKPETELFKRFNGNETFKGIINGLAGYTDYEFRMLAYTKVGGIFKGIPKIAKTREGVPGIPRDIRFTQVTYEFVNVQWNAPVRPNGDIIGYEVQYKRNITGAQYTKHQEQIQPFARTARVKGLVFNSYYVFEIRGRTVSGWGPYAAEVVLITTDRQIPESPIILTIPSSSVRSKSIIIKWLPRYDGNSPIRGYNVEFNKDVQGWRAYKHGIPPVVNIPSNITELEVIKLESNTRYQFRVRAINDVGNSPWSEYSKIKTTNPPVPKGAPSNIRVVKKNPTSLFIAWEAPEFTGFSGNLRGYRVSYVRIGGISDPTYINLQKAQTELQISNLLVFTSYEVRLGAFGDSGEGIWTQPYKWRTGEAAPLSAPTNVKVILQSPSKIRVTWVPPNDDSVRGYPLGYKIESTRLDSTTSKRKRRSINDRVKRTLTGVCPIIAPVQTHLAGPYAKEVTLSNLLKFKQYKITVRVYNSFGDGPKSRVQSFYTPADVPGPPYLLSQRVYTNLIDVDFDRPCDANGAILGYKIEYRERTSSTLIPLTYDKNTRRVRITGLIPLTGYYLELSARTNVGYGKKAAIEFYTKGSPRKPNAPDAPDVYENTAGILRLTWNEGDNGYMPVNRFYMQYRKGSGNWIDFRTISASEILYDGSMVVYTVIGLKHNEAYRFRVKSETDLGVSPFSLSSKPIKTALIAARTSPFYKEIWFIFVMIIIFLILLLILLVCCYRYRSKKGKYKQVNQPKYNLSSFEMAMVTSDNEGSRDKGNSRNGSLSPSVASSKKPLLIKNDARRTSSNSIAKSVNPSDKEADNSDATDIENRNYRGRNKGRDTDSIANHYSHDPFHKNWQDSMDKTTKKALLAEYKKRPPSQGSTDTLGEKKRSDSEELLSRPRVRPGRRDMTERKNLARSEPFLAENEAPMNPRNPPQHVRRPGKKPVDQELTRSVPDLNRGYRNDNQVARQPSFLRATGRGRGSANDVRRRESDNESLNEILDKEKSKRELAMEYDNRIEDFYPHAPPPYDYNGAPPAYTPSQQDDMSDGGRSSNYEYPTRTKPYYPPPPRLSENSDSSRQSSSRYAPQRSIDQPDRGGYYNHGRDVTPQKGREPPVIKTKPKIVPPPKPKFIPPPQRSYTPDHEERTSNSGFAPPQNSKFDDEFYDDGIEELEPDMTLV